MEFIITGIIIVTAPLVTIWLINSARRKTLEKQDDDISHYVIRLPKLILVLGIGCCLLFGGALALSTVSLLIDRDYATLAFTAPLFLTFTLMGAAFIYGYIIFRIEVSGGAIRYRGLLRKEKNFTFADFTAYSIAQGGYGVESFKLYIGKKCVLTVENVQAGYELFKSQAKAAGIPAKRKR